MSAFQLTGYYLWKKIKQKPTEQSVETCIRYNTLKRKEMLSSNKQICRVCKNPADIPISNKIEDTYISSAIRTVANISVNIGDCFPQHICLNCLNDLTIALTFKKKCESSNWMFHQSCTKTIHINNSVPMIIHDFALILHQMKQNREVQQYVPKISCNGNKSNGQLEMSNDVNINLKDKSESLKVYICKRCDLQFDNKGLLLEHRLEQNCVCPPCPICGKLVSNLSRHKKIVHFRNDKFTCHICGKVFYSSGGLRNHLLVHSDKFEYSCSLCPYKGKQQSYLTLHMRVHTGERPYLCFKCPAKFVNPSNLRKHQLTHSNKKFQCNMCKKQFRLQKTLQEHYDAAHLNVRYRCSICGRELWTRRKLLSHELKVHKREKRKLYEETYKVVVND